MITPWSPSFTHSTIQAFTWVQPKKPDSELGFCLASLESWTQVLGHNTMRCNFLSKCELKMGFCLHYCFTFIEWDTYKSLRLVTSTWNL